jgi:N-acetyl-anhydromuramyl-L-alanine amidase AmpD
MRRIHWIIIHHSASSNPAQDSLAAIKAFHTGDTSLPIKWGKYETYCRGWRDVGYHYFIDSKGGRFKGRHEDIIGAHTKGHNAGSIGICLSGDGKFSEDQMIELEVLCKELCEKHGISKQDILGHRDLAATECPGFDVSEITSLWNWH